MRAPAPALGSVDIVPSITSNRGVRRVRRSPRTRSITLLGGSMAAAIQERIRSVRRGCDHITPMIAPFSSQTIALAPRGTLLSNPA